jgi:arylsulfatase
MNRKPNILWICSDQQRFDTLGCYGNTFVHTPNIDRLAQHGTLFENAYCQSPICTPSRASFLTGRYPRTCRTRQNGQEIPESEILVTKLLRDSGGYHCGLSGKLHLSPASTDRCHDEERRIDDGYAVFNWSHNPRRTAEGYPRGNQYRNWLDSQGIPYKTEPFVLPGADEGRTTVKGIQAGKEYWRTAPLVELGMPEEFHYTTWCVDRAIEFIKTHEESATPWLFSINFYDPHHPMDPPEKYLARYLDLIEQIPLPECREGELKDKPLFHHDPIECQYRFKTMSPYEHRLVKAAYWAMIDLIDAQVGRLLAALEETQQLEDTLIIFMSDHGEILGDHGIYLKGPYFYEPTVRVPLIFSWPGIIRSGLRRSALVELMDIPETLLDAAHVDVFEGMQGKSLWPLLTGQQQPDRHKDNVYCEFYNTLACHENPKAYATMLRNDRYKIVRYHGIDQGELYDLEADPGEFNNLWADPACIEIKTKLLGELCDRMAFTMDPLPPRVAGY